MGKQYQFLGQKSLSNKFKKELIHNKPSYLKSILALNLFSTSPAFAEVGKIFDFNATLPIMAVQFIALMVFLDENWFSPVGKVLDQRNEKVRTLLCSFNDGREELVALQTEAETILKDARTEAKAKISEAKANSAEKAEAKLATQKAKLNDELAGAIIKLETEKDAAQKELDSQAGELSKYILERVLPAGFSL